jgi:membrane-bound inhibitor of C-type lysozyme
MKNAILCFVCAAILPFAGCSHSDKAADLKSETGRGTFVSANGEAVTAVYSKEGSGWDHATVRLFFPDKTEARLNLAISASGARYTNETAQWWEHQGEATYEVQGTNIFRGKLTSSR